MAIGYILHIAQKCLDNTEWQGQGFVCAIGDAPKSPYNVWESTLTGREFPYEQVMDFWLEKQYEDVQGRFDAVMECVLDCAAQYRITGLLTDYNCSELCFFEDGEMTCKSDFIRQWCEGRGRYSISSHTEKRPFPAILDNAKVLYYTDRGDYGAVYWDNGTIAEQISYLAVCIYDSGHGAYLFGCNDSFDVVADSLCDSVEECLKAAFFPALNENVQWNKR